MRDSDKVLNNVVELYRFLLTEDYPWAAVGLLADQLYLACMAHFEEKVGDDSDPVAPDGVRVTSHLVARYRENLMEMLDDPDGSITTEFLTWFQKDNGVVNYGNPNSEIGQRLHLRAENTRLRLGGEVEPDAGAE